MRHKKKNLRNKTFFASKTFIVLLLIFFSIPLTIYLTKNEQSLQQNAQQAVVSPPFFCEGSCPDVSPSESPALNPVTSTVPTSTVAVPETSIMPSETPCENDTSLAQDTSYQDNAKDAKRGFFEQIIEFILKLFQKLIELLTGKSGDSPTSSQPEPTAAVESPEEETPKEEPSEAPQEEPQEEPEAEPTEAPQQQQPCNPPVNEPSEAPEPSSIPSSAPSTAPGTDVPPSADTCSGKYKLTNPRGQNFGDPQCNFDKNALFTQLQQADAANADIWFNEVVPCESSYNPNAYAGPATGTPDAGGAWGLFQMGQGKNGQYDHGDVVWGMQASNAVNYKNITIKGSWRYWACAKSHW